jgi:polysaccharide export outer membrane protein
MSPLAKLTGFHVAAGLALLVSVIAGCRPSAPFVWAKDLAPASRQISTETLRPGDKVFVVVQGQDALSGEFEIRPAGELIVPVIGPLPAAGLSPIQLSAAVRAKMTGLLADPHVSVVLSHRITVVSVIGEVKTPGRYELGKAEGVLQALARAGGLGQFADEDAIYVVRSGPRGQRIRFRYSDLTSGDASSNLFELLDDDVIVVE